jgi:hypothetical protein
MRQIELETTTWHTLRGAANEAILAALESKDFKDVPVQPFIEADPGTYGFPPTAQMETKLVEAYDSDEINCDEQIGLQLQINTLESFRRAYASRRQGKREMIAHLKADLGEVTKQTDIMLQNMVGTAKQGAHFDE